MGQPIRAQPIPSRVPLLLPVRYVLAAAVNAIAPESFGVCTVAGLRAINTVLGLATVPVLAALLAALRGRPRLGLDDDDLWMEAAVIALFPMHFFFHFLAYTDTASTLLVLLGILLAYRGRGRASAAVRLQGNEHARTGPWY